jgi:hypothetical protein
VARENLSDSDALPELEALVEEFHLAARQDDWESIKAILKRASGSEYYPEFIERLTDEAFGLKGRDK